MKVMHFDRKTGELKAALDIVEDLWHLSKVIAPGDLAEGSTYRSVKFGDKEERKRVFIAVQVEDVEFSKSVNRLRLRGKIVRGSPEEFVQLGRYHTLELEPGDKIQIIKQWKNYELNRLKEAEKETKKPRLRIVVLDEEKALTAIVRGFGVEYGPELESKTSKRDEKHEEKALQYLGDVAAEIEKHEERYVVAGPGFTKENLKKFLEKRKPELLKRITFENCSYAERSGVDELLKKGVVERLIGEERVERETKLMDELTREISKEGLAAYGLKEVAAAAEAFAVEKLLVLDSFLRASPEAEKLAEVVDRNRGAVIVIAEDSDPGLKLKGFGKIAAFLKFRLRD
jgi:protein pelota